jgi:nitroreductase
MEFRDVVATRRSIRRYKTDPVPDDVVNQIFEAARIAPSAGHRQPWHFIVVQDAATKKQLGVASWAAEAPLILVGCVDTAVRSPPLCYVDLAIALEHIVLAAANFGVGTCWIGRLGREDPIKAVLGIPNHVAVVAVTPFGYPDETPEPKMRKALADIIHYDAF